MYYNVINYLFQIFFLNYGVIILMYIWAGGGYGVMLLKFSSPTLNCNQLLSVLYFLQIHIMHCHGHYAQCMKSF